MVIWNPTACGTICCRVHSTKSSPLYEEMAVWKPTACGTICYRVQSTNTSPLYEEMAVWNPTACGPICCRVQSTKPSPLREGRGTWNPTACRAVCSRVQTTAWQDRQTGRQAETETTPEALPSSEVRKESSQTLVNVQEKKFERAKPGRVVTILTLGLLTEGLSGSALTSSNTIPCKGQAVLWIPEQSHKLLCCCFCECKTHTASTCQTCGFDDIQS